jgi:hypothetical protein
MNGPAPAAGVGASYPDGQPVGSRAMPDSGLSLSSATIRNVMADLQELGFVIRPHLGRTGAHRSGYRFFVDAVARGTAGRRRCGTWACANSSRGRREGPKGWWPASQLLSAHHASGRSGHLATGPVASLTQIRIVGLTGTGCGHPWYSTTARCRTASFGSSAATGQTTAARGQLPERTLPRFAEPDAPGTASAVEETTPRSIRSCSMRLRLAGVRGGGPRGH